MQESENKGNHGEKVSLSTVCPGNSDKVVLGETNVKKSEKMFIL